jgi:hypothetical protein
LDVERASCGTRTYGSSWRQTRRPIARRYAKSPTGPTLSMPDSRAVAGRHARFWPQAPTRVGAATRCRGLSGPTKPCLPQTTAGAGHRLAGSQKNTEGTKTLRVSFQSQMPNLGQQPALRQHRHPAKGARSSAQEPRKAPVEVKDYAATRVLLAVRGRRCNRGCFSTQSSPCVPAPARVLDREETGVDPVVRDCPSWGPRATNEYTP